VRIFNVDSLFVFFWLSEIVAVFCIAGLHSAKIVWFDL